MSTCQQHKHEHGRHDPTLDSCSVLGTPTVSASSHEEWSSMEESTEEEAELLKLRDARLRQLKQDSQQIPALEPEGHGNLIELSQAQSLEAIGSGTTVICHMFCGGVQACEQLNEHLHSVAHKYLQARFIYIRVTQSKRVLPELGVVPVPGLVTYHKGVVTGAAPLQAFGDASEVDEHQIDAWLRKKLSNHSALNKASLTCDSDQDDEDDGDKPCSLCGRQFPHEHIRSVYTASPYDSDSDSDS
ncbi:hypothetical protein WJX77_004431 [Trebouxia sp. C0004]